MEVGKFFKKTKGKWRYHPYGTVIDKVFVTVKEGQKQAFQDALSREMPIAMVTSVLLVVLGAFDVRLLFLGLPTILYLVFYRKYLIKKYCTGTYKANFLKYYFQSVYFFLDETNNSNIKTLAVAVPCFTVLSFAMFQDSKSFGAWFCAVMAFLSAIVLSITLFKRWQN